MKQYSKGQTVRCKNQLGRKEYGEVFSETGCAVRVYINRLNQIEIWHKSKVSATPGIFWSDNCGWVSIPE